MLKKASKTFSRTPYCTFIAGSEQLPLTSQHQFEVRAMFIAGIFSEIIK